MTRTAKVLIAGALGWAMGVTVLRTLRPPNDFAEAHWLLDYRFGFVRRGLAGATLRAISSLGIDLQTESAIGLMSYAAFAVLCAALFAVAIRVVARSGWNLHISLIVAAFLTSPFVVTSAHLMGYLDHVVYILTIAAVWLTLRGSPWWGASLAAIGVFVHESTLVVSVPLLALAAVMVHAATPDARRLRRGLVALLLPLAAFALVAIIEAMFTDRPALCTLLQLRLHRYPFVQGDMHLFVPEWLTTSFAENATAQRHRLLERLTDGPIVLSVLPALQAILFGAFARMEPAHRRLAGTGLVVVACAPLVLHLSAWDTARLWTYTIGSAFCGLWILAETLRGTSSHALALTPVVAIPVVLDNVVGRIPLLDGVTERFSSPSLLALYAPAALAYVVFWVVTSRTRGGNHG